MLGVEASCGRPSNTVLDVRYLFGATESSCLCSAGAGVAGLDEDPAQTHDHGPQHAHMWQADEPSELRPDKPFLGTDDSLRRAVHCCTHIQNLFRKSQY